MKHIDFLPARYREQNLLRQGQLLRVAALVLFGVVLMALAGGQYVVHQTARRQLDAVAPQHADAKAKTQQLAQLQQELEDAQAATRLYAYLAHPWPRTRIVAALAEKLPASLTLLDVRLKREVVQLDPADPRRRALRERDPEAEEAAARLPAAVRDLARLREENDAGLVLIEISGLAPDIASLHTYIGELSLVPLFAKCELVSLEAIGKDKDSGQARFQVRIVVRPGYAQPERQASENPTVAAVLQEPAQ